MVPLSLGLTLVVLCVQPGHTDLLGGVGRGVVESVVEKLPVPVPMVGKSTPTKAPTNNGSRALDGSFGEKKKQGISGFLGVDEVLDPIIQLVKLLPGTVDNKEPECTRTYFMGPYAKPVTFVANGSIGDRKDRSCRWNFIGTEPCIPLLSCEEFRVTRENGSCQDSFEVRDGNYGYENFCGESIPTSISAHGGLRDLFIRCSNRGTGTPLKDYLAPFINPLCQCGRRPNVDLIVNGENATKHEFPWIAALVRAKTRQPFCGASAINDQFLITAAHCFKGEYLQVSKLEAVLGAQDMEVTPNFAMLNASSRPSARTYDDTTLESIDSGNGSVRFEIDEIIIHPLYVGQTNDFDVAVIKLSTRIDFAKYSQLSPVCLPKLGSYLRTYAQHKAIVAGWGLGGAQALGTNPTLQKLNVRIYTPNQCKEVYAHRVSRRMLCAGYPDGGRDSCMGDSGGPLIVEDTRHLWRQVGSVSWGEGCAESDNPGAYIRMTEVGQWIHYHSNVNEAVWCEVPQQAAPLARR